MIGQRQTRRWLVLIVHHPGIIPIVFGPLYFLSDPQLLLTSPLMLIMTGVWLWMLIYCIRNDPERNVWLWVLIIIPPIGTLVYFFARWLPQARLKPPRFLNRISRGKELQRLQIAARQIGNSHQFIQLGDAQRDTGRYEQAGDSYFKALEKEPENIQALWGLAQVEMHWKQYDKARPRLESVLAVDPSYKFGDVSLAYGRCLLELNDQDAAFAHLTEHLKRWKTPESQVVYAQLLYERGETDEAREMLEGMILEVSGGPKFFRRQSARWVRDAKRMLAKMPRPQ